MADRWAEIKSIFLAALERRREERNAFLDEACLGDESLRREVEQLLTSHEAARSFIESPAVATPSAIPSGVQQQALSVGQSIGHYLILSLLGRGGMGEVYLAHDSRLGRRVALKLLPVKFTRDRERVRRFTQEARTASAISHPNIAHIYEVREEIPNHYIAMEYVEGKSLRQRIAEGKLGVREALEISTQIASALSAAHKTGVVHRDIKPENVMVRPDGYVKVLDFGLAKLTEGAVKDQQSDSEAATRPMVNTEPGVVMGTATYMSPEQARGLAVDARTDIWSLGVVLYEMLSGRIPFEGEMPSDVIASILKTEPPPLTQPSPYIPAELQRIVGKALRKDREERYQTAKDLLLDLKSFGRELEVSDNSIHPVRNGASGKSTGGEKISGERDDLSKAAGAAADTSAVGTRQTSSAEYIVGEIKRHRHGFAAALAALLLTAISFGYWYYLHQRSAVEQISSIAVLPFVNASGNADMEYLSDGMTESLINSLSQLQGLSVKARTTVFRYKGKDATPQQVSTELSVQGVLNGRVVQRGDQLTLGLELVDARTGDQIWGKQYNRRMADLVSLQSDIARDVSGSLRARLTGTDMQRIRKSYTENTEAYQLYLKGRFYLSKGAVRECHKAIESFQQAIAGDPAYALAYAGIADAYWMLSAIGGSPPREAMPKAREAALRALSLDDQLAEAHTALGFIHLSYDYDFAGAEREYRRAVELKPSNPPYGLHADLLIALGRYEEAIAEARRELETDPLSAVLNTHYGSTLLGARRYHESIAQLNKVTGIGTKLSYCALLPYGSLSNAREVCRKCRSTRQDV